MIEYKPHLYLTDEEYLRILQNLKEEIQNDAKLVYENSDAPGDNYNYCSWGLCSISKSIAPEPTMHLWPDRFVKESKVAMKYRQPHQKCPLDKRQFSTSLGCFYSCRIFNKGRGKLPKPAEVLTLVNRCIESIKRRMEE